jgi:hypothetical protein
MQLNIPKNSVGYLHHTETRHILIANMMSILSYLDPS